MRALVTCGIVTMLVGCGIVEPIDPRPFEPGTVQHDAAQHVSECTSVQIHAGDVVWFAVSGFDGDGDALGKWSRPDSIFLDEDWLGSFWLSAHELVHVVVAEDDSKHQHAWWLECLPADWR